MLTAIADGIWIDSSPIRILGTALTATMTILRLNDGGLLVHSPLAMSAERRAAIDALGPVRHLYAPNLYHHLSLGDWSATFPAARVHGPRGLTKKRPDLRVDRIHHEQPEPAFADLIDEHPIHGFRLRECALVHRPSGTLVVADLVHNVGRPRDAWTSLYTRAMGFHGRVALSRIIRWTAFSDRAAARQSIDQLLAAPFDKLIVGHGEPLSRGGKQALADAFTWLRPRHG